MSEAITEVPRDQQRLWIVHPVTGGLVHTNRLQLDVVYARTGWQVADPDQAALAQAAVDNGYVGLAGEPQVEQYRQAIAMANPPPPPEAGIKIPGLPSNLEGLTRPELETMAASYGLDPAAPEHSSKVKLADAIRAAHQAQPPE